MKSIRDWLNKHPAAMAAVVLALFAIAGTAVYLTTRGERPSTSTYYYDLGTGKLFAVANERLLPRPELADIPAPSGGKSARAYVYSCGACKEGEWQIAYIERHTEEGRRAAQQLVGTYEGDLPEEPDDERPVPGELEEIAMSGREVAAPATSPQWVAAKTTEGQELTMAPIELCQGRPPSQCYP